MKYLNSSFLLILLPSAHALSAADPATWTLWPGAAPGEVKTLPLTNLFVSMLHAVDVPVKTFADSTGSMTELLA